MKAPKQKEAVTGARQRIIDAALTLFTRHGYAAVKTRDIASEAGINLALLNYYFGGKEKLFEIVMLENLGRFFKGVSLIVNDESTTFYRKIELLVDFYITRLTDNPDLPLFVLTQAKNNPKRLPPQVQHIGTSLFLKQYRDEVKAGRLIKMNEGHLMLNLLGLSIFPFSARSMAKKIRNISDEEFIDLMKERRKLIPQWMKAMLQLKK
ncbi:MAG: TetR/AcrR family transcriptional regulator [Bacteroidia bacterium]|nr:TetR/AcrR family transcriptional regulator [Bacteroidia bacterium]